MGMGSDLNFGLMVSGLGLFLLWLANMADRSLLSQYRKTGFILAAVVYTVMVLAFLGMLFQNISVVTSKIVKHGNVIKVITPKDISFIEGLGSGFSSTGKFLLILMPFIGFLVLLKPLRRLIAHLIPIDPDRLVHTSALAVSIMFIWNFILPVYYGVNQSTDSVIYVAEPKEKILEEGLLFVFELSLSFVGVGWLSRRSFKACLKRLKIVVPTGRQVLIAVIVGAGSRLIFSSVSYFAMYLEIWSLPMRNWSFVFTFLIAGVGAGVAEETLMRGVLLPRFGLLFTSVLFAVLHTHGLTFYTLVPFLYGLIFGLIYKRYNTPTAMVAHATANITSSLITKILFYTRPF
ncbi:MAG TPA: CPBP family intramembrane glutamic endopeptidase [Bacillales bacterium]